MTWLVLIPLAAALLLASTSIAYVVGALRVVAKSSQHFCASHLQVARHVIYVDAPGALTQNLKRVPFRKIARPKWPFVR